MELHEVENIARSVLTHYGVGANVGRVTLSGRDWHVEVIDSYKTTTTTVIITTDTAQGVRKAIMAAFDVEG